jgi:hypothetical protein
MANRVTYQNIFSESWNNIYSLVNSKTNIIDPTTTSSEYRKWIYSREPDVKSIEFKGYPFIIVNPAEQDFENTGKSLDGKSQTIAWTIVIEVVCSDRGFNNNDGKGLTHLDAISDDVFQTFKNMTNRKTLMTNGLYFFDVSASGVSTEPLSEELVYKRTFVLAFKTKMQISS